MDQEYTRRLLKIENELERWLPDSVNQSLADEVFSDTGMKMNADAIQVMLDPLRDMISRGGKRWRPLLMTLVCEAFSGGDASIPLSPLVEFCHNASLIHDDIEDESDQRRGKPSIHKIYGVDTAINSGAFLYFLSTCCINSCQIKEKEFIYKLWTVCMRKLHLGQSMDINWHRNISYVPSMDQYYTMSAMKTGGLARFAAELGCIAANTPKETVKLMGEAAEKMGVGFQILDDVKNLTTGIPGKKRGDDIVEGKKSLPILMYMEKYPDKKEIVFYNFHVAKTDGITAPEVEEMIDVITASGVLKEAEEKGQTLLKEVKNIFNQTEIAGCKTEEKGRSLLTGFIGLLD